MRHANILLSKAYRLITGSIAFYPTLITIGFLLFLLAINMLEYEPFLIGVKSKIDFLLLKSKEDARLVLGTLVGSIISLMVFSFSMVMIVLNRASATLSPRVIPGLITDKSNQIVLGFYLGSITYSLALIVNIQSGGDHQIPEFGLLMAMIFGLGCLGLFMFFIHSISQSIQVDNILKRIQLRTELAIKAVALGQNEQAAELPETGEWETLASVRAGYLREIKTGALLKICKNENIYISLRQSLGCFIVKGYPYLSVNGQVSEEVQSEIHDCFLFNPQERLEDHFLFGFKQISEIGIKALSPGINDPGTAVKAINMLSILFIKKMETQEKCFKQDTEGTARLFYHPVTLDVLFFQNFTEIREYGKDNLLVMLALFDFLKNLLYADKDEKHRESVLKQLKGLTEACEGSIINSLDIEMVNNKLKAINSLTGSGFEIVKRIER